MSSSGNNSLGTCCGDRFYGILPVDRVKEQMTKPVNEMSVAEIEVYV